MTVKWSGSGATTPSNDSQIFDDVEKGLKPTAIESLPSPVSPIHEGITPTSSFPALSQTLLPACHFQEKNPAPGPPAVKATTTVQPRPKPSRWILFRLWFSTYRKFFTFIVALNLTGIILAILGRFPYAENHLGALLLGNLLTAVLMRNELFLRFLYFISIYGLRSWAPTCFKIAVTSALQHVGGIHSGCALSGAAWLVYKVADIVVHRASQHGAVIATGIITSILVIISILSAFPWVRNNHHNTFERHHRFIGWLGLAPSPKVAILKFERGMQQGLLGRISRTSIMEYHAFGIISEGRKSGCHYMICGVQGDFTKGLVADPPKTVWTRELKFAGVGHASAMFKRGIRICTGTGIGAALSTCIQSPNWCAIHMHNFRLYLLMLFRFFIWIGSDQEKTFGPTISGLIHKHIEPDRMILWDSKQRGGRPDTLQLLQDVYKSFGAEVIFITSNKQGNDEMMQGCLATGMNAFGTLWDF
ncbi:conserved hypothetical protein [Verticillium alfalfae VaMs.102]|uniref:Non-ribosomal peptide synthetase n=1 Tax=Verticillium alfalfae (strain VaMs.102 / ATCC MYA-4576 / FGSC 10136) TaxID=526221 RepID=C9SU31_VERA1|nr:conserved hypothetical protein [Verticillium alfalfae VaMs.102]EEY22342.1 conserved hypothetical protein [Verticillium alfalfae VaMs.102]